MAKSATKKAAPTKNVRNVKDARNARNVSDEKSVREVRTGRNGPKPTARAGKKAAAAQKPVTSARKPDPAKEAARQEAARGKLERVRVPSPKREDGSEGKYVYCVIRSDQPLSFGPL